LNHILRKFKEPDMTRLSRRGLCAGALAAGGGLALPVLAQSQASVEVIVPVGPPAPRVEVTPEVTVEQRDREYWQPGYWRCSGKEHEWYEGRYVVRPRSGAVWVPGHWERRGAGWIYVDGHWS
jgi:hypothetical protein